MCFLFVGALINGISMSSDVRIVSSTTVFDLKNDLIISGYASPFFADKTFGQNGPEKLVIKSQNNSCVIIDTHSTWDITSFSGKYKTIEFAGNARLLCRPGSKLIGKGGVLRFTDNAQWIITKESK